MADLPQLGQADAQIYMAKSIGKHNTDIKDELKVPWTPRQEPSILKNRAGRKSVPAFVDEQLDIAGQDPTKLRELIKQMRAHVATQDVIKRDQDQLVLRLVETMGKVMARNKKLLKFIHQAEESLWVMATYVLELKCKLGE